MELDGGLVLAEGLDVAAGDVHALLFNRVAEVGELGVQVALGDGAKHLAAVASLDRERERHALQAVGEVARAVEFLGLALDTGEP